LLISYKHLFIALWFAEAHTHAPRRHFATIIVPQRNADAPPLQILDAHSAHFSRRRHEIQNTLMLISNDTKMTLTKKLRL
jgi:hypothetical protein